MYKTKKCALYFLIFTSFIFAIFFLIDSVFTHNALANQGETSNERSESAVFNASDHSLNFYYDNIEHTGDKVFKNFKNYEGSPEWTSPLYREQVWYASFDESFKDFRPLNCSYWFSDYVELQKIENLENLNISESSKLDNVFTMNYKLSGVLDLSSWDFSNVSSMNLIFADCHELTKIIFPEKTNLQNCMWMDHIFDTCKNLESIENLENFKLGKAISIEQCFQDCKKLTKTLNLSKWDTSTIKVWNLAFNGCTGLTEIILPKNLTIKPSNLTAVFQKCSNLKTIDISSFDLNSFEPFKQFTTMQYMFFGCSNLERIFVNPNTNLQFDSEATTQFMFDYCNKLKGMNGTICNPEQHKYLQYTCIDGKDGKPGYFSVKESKIPNPNQLTYTGTEQEAISASYLYNVKNNVQTNAGNYVAEANLVDPEFMTWSDGSNNTKHINYLINKSTLIAKYIDESIYQWQQPQLLCEVSGFLNGETESTALNYVAPSVKAESNLKAGTYTLTPQGGSSENYDFIYESGTLTVCSLSDLVQTGDFWIFLIAIFSLIGSLALFLLTQRKQYKI